MNASVSTDTNAPFAMEFVLRLILDIECSICEIINFSMDFAFIYVVF